MDNNIVSQHAKIQIDKYSNIKDKNKVCTRCGFEKTKQCEKNGFCLLCNNFYDFHSVSDKEIKIKNLIFNINMCVIN
jgi:hypothetical protein